MDQTPPRFQVDIFAIVQDRVEVVVPLCYFKKNKQIFSWFVEDEFRSLKSKSDVLRGKLAC